MVGYVRELVVSAILHSASEQCQAVSTIQTDQNVDNSRQNIDLAEVATSNRCHQVELKQTNEQPV